MIDDADFCVLHEWLLGEVYSVPPVDRLNYRHTWTMSPEYLAYCREVLDTYWQPTRPLGAETYLLGYEIEVDEKYDVPRLVRK